MSGEVRTPMAAWPQQRSGRTELVIGTQGHQEASPAPSTLTERTVEGMEAGWQN